MRASKLFRERWRFPPNSQRDQRIFLILPPAECSLRMAMGIEANLHPRHQAAVPATATPSHDDWSENERPGLSKAETSPFKDRRKKRTRCAKVADTCPCCSSPILTRVAHRLESIQIPTRRIVCCKQLIEKYGGSTLHNGQQTGGEEPSESASSLPEYLPLISGLTPVISGAAPAADTVRILSIKPPRYIFYSLSGFLCDIVQLVIDLAVHFLFNVRDPPTCWLIGFGLSIVVRHSSHRYLTFGAYVGGYWRSLGRMYGGYSISIALSTAFNMIMARMGVPHYVAFVFTLLWTGIINYFTLKRLWSFGGSAGVGAKDAKLEKQDSSV